MYGVHFPEVLALWRSGPVRQSGDIRAVRIHHKALRFGRLEYFGLEEMNCSVGMTRNSLEDSEHCVHLSYYCSQNLTGNDVTYLSFYRSPGLPASLFLYSFITLFLHL